MARVIHVKKAAKDHPKQGIKKGQEYWWAGYRLGRSSFKRYWKSKPRPSQVTASEYVGNVLSVQEEIQDAQPSDLADLEQMRDGWAERLREIAQECEDKRDALPESFQEAGTGALLQERADSMETWADEIEGVDLDWEEGVPDDDETPEETGEDTDTGDPLDENGQTFADYAQEKLEEMAQGCPE